MSVTIRRSVLIPHPAAHVFDIIEAAEHYPQFLPWCAGATILERSDEVVAARLTVAWRQVRFSFVTRNPKRRPEWMSIGLQEGPFRSFEGTWRLLALADWGCRVDFTLSYEFNASLLDPLAGPMFERATSTLVDAFVQRADQVPRAAPQAAAAPVADASPTAPDAVPPGAGPSPPPPSGTPPGDGPAAGRPDPPLPSPPEEAR